jgi:hypothetical protein
MKRNLFALSLLTVTIFLAACAGPSPQISLEVRDFTFGEVVNGTIAEKDITITNLGSDPLVVDSVSTSCGCTTAVIDQFTIEPGASSLLHIEFDSGAHGPDMTGELMRQIFIKSNDPKNPDVIVTFTVKVVK